jgi:hypothetical protein
MSAPYTHADQIGGTATQLLVRDCLETESIAEARRTPALERLEQSLGGQMTQRLLCALSGDHRMRARGLPLDGSSSP